MATVIIPALLTELCGGLKKVAAPGATLGEVLRAVDAQCPGFYARIVQNGRVRPELALAHNGEIYTMGLHEPLGPDDELALVPAIGGG